MPLVPKSDALPLVDNVNTAFKTDISIHLHQVVMMALLGIPIALIGTALDSGGITVCGLLPLFIWLVYRYVKQKQRFMQLFGERYGFSYEKDRRPGGRYPCRLFNIGHSRQMSNILHGVYEERPIELFHYNYTTGSGKHQQTHFFTACIIEFEGDLPDLVLEEKRFLGGDGLKDRHHRSLKLEGPFGETFRVFGSEDLEIEAYEVLTPDIMEFLMRRGGTYSFEFRGHRLYVVENNHLTTRRELEKLIEFAGAIVDRLGPRLARLHDDVEAIKDAHARAA